LAHAALTARLTLADEFGPGDLVSLARSIGFNALDAATTSKVPALFVVAEKEELSNNAVVEQVHTENQKRGVATAYHDIKDITHYGIYRQGFAEATRLEIEWFVKHLKGTK
jgi:hypothetical protein